VHAPISLPDAPPMEVWDELALEAMRFLKLHVSLKAAPLSDTERQILERDMLRSLTFLRVNTEKLERAVNEALEGSGEGAEHDPPRASEPH